MGSPLAGAARATDLVPGDPGELRDLAGRLDTFAAELDEAAQLVSVARTSTGWTGAAATVFQAAQAEQPGKLTAAAGSFSAAAAALRRYAGSLEDAQLSAGRALTSYQDAQAATRSWHSATTQAQATTPPGSPAPAPGPDPGAGGRTPNSCSPPRSGRCSTRTASAASSTWS